MGDRDQEKIFSKASPEAKRRGNPNWRPGISGNPAGYQKGSKHRTTMLVEAMYDGAAERIVDKILELALAGDPGCLKICADRLSAPIKGRSINFVLPELKTISDAIGALATITDGLTDGRLLPEAAEALTVSVMAFAKVIELNELEARLTALEQARDQQDVQSGARYDA